MKRCMNIANEQPVATDVVLASDVPEGAAFVRFDTWIDVQLEKLVARWQSAAAPNARGRGVGTLNTVTPPISRS